MKRRMEKKEEELKRRGSSSESESDKEEPMDTDSVKQEIEIDSAKTDKSGLPPAEVKQEPGSEEDDDPVIHEIPVFLSRSISKLYLFQARICISKTSDSYLILI